MGLLMDEVEKLSAARRELEATAKRLEQMTQSPEWAELKAWAAEMSQRLDLLEQKRIVLESLDRVLMQEAQSGREREDNVGGQ